MGQDSRNHKEKADNFLKAKKTETKIFLQVWSGNKQRGTNILGIKKKFDRIIF